MAKAEKCYQINVGCAICTKWEGENLQLSIIIIILITILLLGANWKKITEMQQEKTKR